LRRKRILCIDCNNIFVTSLFSRSLRCLKCRKKYREGYIYKWKQKNKDRVRIHNQRIHNKRKMSHNRTSVNLGTLHSDELEIRDGHIAGWTKLERMTGSFGG
jgi:hypothetical protein